ncbi:MAG: ABC transporter substrate-binding protein [Candidatus Shapirobacteria bacterium]|nr:ABC transporter substrate-binding protein [Candidatus Shapirobacteria bacterium]
MFTKIHFKIEYLFSYIKRKFVFFLIGFIIITLSVIFKTQIIDFYNSPNFHTQIIGLEGLYTTNNLPKEISNKISYGLTTISENSKPINSPLVKSISIENDNKNYIFTLNENFLWHNGKKFTSYDVDYQISGATITPISNNQLKISLSTEFSPLLSILSKPFFKKNLIGLGQYQVKKITYQDGYIKTLFLKSLDKSKSSLEYHFYSNESDVIDAFKLGNVDEIKIGSLPQEFINWKNTNITKEIKTDDKYIAIFLNTQKIINKQTRQALSYATPKPKDKNERCLGPISPISWAYNPSIKEYDLNSTRAKELFNKDDLPEINLTINNRNLLSMAEEIKNSWSNILGIKTSISIVNQIDFQNFDAILAYSSTTNDPDQYSFWHSTQTNTNITKLDNSRIDKLLEDGRTVVDSIERKKIYQDFQRYLLEESPAIFISYPITYNINRTK